MMKRIILVVLLSLCASTSFAQQSPPPTVNQLIHASALSCQNEKNADQQTILQLIQQSDNFSAQIQTLEKKVSDFEKADKDRAAKDAKVAKAVKGSGIGKVSIISKKAAGPTITVNPPKKP